MQQDDVYSAASISDNHANALVARIVHFAKFLRDNGINADSTALLAAIQIAEISYLSNRDLLRAGFKSCFCQRASDWHSFDLLFESFWCTENVDSDGTDEALDSDELQESDRETSKNRLVGFAGVSSQEQENTASGAGDFKALSLSDFRFVFDAKEQQAIQRLVDSLARRCRRQYFNQRKIKSSGYRIAMRKVVQRAVSQQGKIVHFRFYAKRRRLPKVVLLIDVSQSMDVYSKLFLRFTRQLLSVFETSEAFAFNTHLMPLGTGWSNLDEKAFEKRLNEQTNSWLGGTRIAASMDEFNRGFLRNSVNKRTTVVIFSDGCDTAKPEELAAQLEPVQRKAKQLVWVNPLLGRFSPGEKDKDMDPLQRCIDVYSSAHNLKSLAELEHVLLR